MSLFQKSVEKKYLNDLDSTLIDKKYADFQNYFGDSEIQENIRNSKEEQFQEGFLRELFVSILEYTLNPHANFNLTTELKNITNSKKADGAILKGEDATAVIELKGTETTDLDKIETQAFGYKNHHPKCKYVITSNFEKLRFYIQNAVDHVDFDLFNLSKEQFSLLWLCLAKDNLLNDLPLKIKESSVLQEENITKKLYADYSKFREAIYNNLVKNNPETDKLLLFKKTQKLLDRFLFIFFAEDRLLLPPNSISEIVRQWTNLKDEYDEYKPLYSRFKKYFGYMNTGFKGKKYDIYAYNGGLFKPDEILDNITIDDEIIHEHTLRLSNYDFETDVDVNILGHIFEHSLGEIENVQAEIKGEKVDNQKTKRKKDGIFYTPKYITKYIVENTVGKLCEEKRTELEIIDEEYAKGRKNRKKELVKSLDKKLEDYRNWLLSLTILDPACGSGAFLNQALEFLINEHRKIDELRGQLLGGAIIFSDITSDILEKNIYGVDLNEESVEIAKLSLWLRTAQKGRKLNTLSNNIKCGNSLIDDPEVAGEKAFNWQNEFPEIFANGGFDVVIGNPPYGASFQEGEKKYLKKEYSRVHMRTPESFNYFILRIETLIYQNGKWGIIIPSSFLNQHEFEKCRKFILEHSRISRVINLGDDVFQDVSTPTCIILVAKKTAEQTFYCDLQKETRNELPNLINEKNRFIHANDFGKNNGYSFIKKANENLISKCYQNKKLADIAEDVATGISPGLGSAFIKTLDEIEKKKLEVELLKKLIIGGEINRYVLNPISTKHVIYATSHTNIESFPNIYKELFQFKEKLEQRVETASGGIPWYVMLRPRRQKLFENEKILIRQTASRILACYDDEQWYCLKSGILIQLPTDSKLTYNYLLSLLNSKLMDFLYQDLVGEGARIFPEVKPVQLFKLPIKEIDINNKSELVLFEQLNRQVKIIQEKYKEFTKSINDFVKFLQTKFSISNLSSKMNDWSLLNSNDFLIELQKAKIKLSLSQEADWINYFNEQKEKAQTLKSEIEKTDKEIDQMVYELYGLTEEEIKIVEANL